MAVLRRTLAAGAPPDGPPRLYRIVVSPTGVHSFARVLSFDSLLKSYGAVLAGKTNARARAAAELRAVFGTLTHLGIDRQPGHGYSQEGSFGSLPIYGGVDIASNDILPRAFATARGVSSLGGRAFFGAIG